jgi:putative PLP-dependent aminotransferase (TIGR04422 family)
MFPTGFPVLFSSGRAALTAALLQSSVSRKDYIDVFPYASHCVLDTVSRVATPIGGPHAQTKDLRIVYHQWGYVQEINLARNTIEDSVDTLCEIGAPLFPGGGSYEIWSLSKILGTSSGGVLWCKDIKSAEIARCYRSSSKNGFVLWILRLIGMVSHAIHLCWQGIEPNMGGVCKLQSSEIYVAISHWQSIVDSRKENLEKIWNHAVSWLNYPYMRLPNVVPMQDTASNSRLKELGISAGHRMLQKFEGDGVVKMERVIPIPIHQDVDSKWLFNIKKFLETVG